jgi:hypothetical protein
MPSEIDCSYDREDEMTKVELEIGTTPPDDDAEKCRLMTNDDGSRVYLQVYHPEKHEAQRIAVKILEAINRDVLRR